MKNFFLAYVLSLGVIPFLSAQPTLTGDAATDFLNCSCPLTVDYADLIGDNGPICISPGPGVAQTGFDVQHVYMYYDAATDRLFIGMDMVGIAGDADGDGDPQNNTLCAQGDCNNCGKPIQAQEAIGINFDVDQDGNWDYFIGWPLGSTQFNLYAYTTPSSSFVPRLNDLAGTVPVTASAIATPPTAGMPDPEFVINAYSLIDADVSMDFNIYTDTPAGGEDLGGVSNVAFPVVLSDFTARFAEHEIVLEWITARESNNLGFEVELAGQNGVFESMGFVQGAGDTEQSSQYHFSLNRYHNGLNYLRLKQIDLDGKFTYSDIVAVNTITSPIALYPTLVDQALGVHRQEASAMRFEIISMSGQILRSGELEAAQQRIDVSQLAPGIYLFRAYGQSESHLSRFVKQ